MEEKLSRPINSVTKKIKNCIGLLKARGSAVQGNKKDVYVGVGHLKDVMLLMMVLASVLGFTD